MKHALVVGVLMVTAAYLVQALYSGQLLYYAGPGDPYWLDDILVWWQIVGGGLLGWGAVGSLWKWTRKGAGMVGELGGEANCD